MIQRRRTEKRERKYDRKEATMEPTMKNLVNDYLKSLDQFLQSSVRLGEAIRNALLPVIPDLNVQVSFPLLNFHSEVFKTKAFDKDTERLVNILESVFNEKGYAIQFDSFFGIYLDRETAQRARQILEQALNENDSV
jgi:hypothetical protein